MDVQQTLTAIFRDVFDDDTIALTDETAAKDIEDWDSLAHIQIIVAAEKAFGVKYSTDEIKNTENVGEFIRITERRIAAK